MTKKKSEVSYTVKKIVDINREELVRRAKEDGDMRTGVDHQQHEEGGFESFISLTDKMDDCVVEGETIREYPPKATGDESGD
jgi:hypothetical protein